MSVCLALLDKVSYVSQAVLELCPPVSAPQVLVLQECPAKPGLSTVFGITENEPQQIYRTLR
jgi:hypothetical protein